MSAVPEYKEYLNKNKFIDLSKDVNEMLTLVHKYQSNYSESYCKRTKEAYVLSIVNIISSFKKVVLNYILRFDQKIVSNIIQTEYWAKLLLDSYIENKNKRSRFSDKDFIKIKTKRSTYIDEIDKYLINLDYWLHREGEYIDE